MGAVGTVGSQTPRQPSTPRIYSSRSIRKPSPKVRLSSPFARPTFPLDAVEPDLKSVPILTIGGRGGTEGDESGSHTPAETFIDEKMAQHSVVVEFTPGIRGYCTAVAIKAVVQLLDCLQAKVWCTTHTQHCLLAAEIK